MWKGNMDVVQGNTGIIKWWWKTVHWSPEENRALYGSASLPCYTTTGLQVGSLGRLGALFWMRRAENAPSNHRTSRSQWWRSLQRYDELKPGCPVHRRQFMREEVLHMGIMVFF
jgi:hypothetical protein